MPTFYPLDPKDQIQGISIDNLKKMATPGGAVYGLHGVFNAQALLVQYYLAQPAQTEELIIYLKYMIANPNYSLDALQSILSAEQYAQLLHLPFENRELITSVNLDLNNMDTRDGMYLVNSIFSLYFENTIESLSFSKNTLHFNDFICLANALKTNNTLTELGLISTNLDEIGVQHLADALKINSKLASLNIKYNFKVSTKSISHLADALEVNTGLTKLSIDTLNVLSAEYLAKALKVNKTLTILAFNMRIESKGHKHFTEALKVNNTLTDLILRFHKETLGMDSQYLAEIFKTNFTLTDLGDFPRHIELVPEQSIEYMEQIIRGIRRNRCIAALKQGIETIDEINAWMKTKYPVEKIGQPLCLREIDDSILKEALETNYIKNIFAARNFATMILFSNGYLQKKEGIVKTDPKLRFFNMAAELPPELQMILFRRQCKLDSNSIPSQSIEKELKYLSKQF